VTSPPGQHQPDDPVDGWNTACGRTAQLVAAVFEPPPVAPGFAASDLPLPDPEPSDLVLPEPAPSDLVAATLPSLAGLAAVPPGSDPDDPEDVAAAELLEPESDDVDADPPASTEDLDSLRLSVR
jgi:hypothetical protein